MLSKKAGQRQPQTVINNNQISIQPSNGIPVSNPSQTTPARRFGTHWSTGLCSCCDDSGNCCVTCICPCITFGQVANILDRGRSSQKCCCSFYTFLVLFGCTACLLSCWYRRKMRVQYKLRESCCPDCLIHCCCEPCALCQMYRELHSYNFDLQLGYKRSMEMEAENAMKAPSTQIPMAR